MSVGKRVVSWSRGLVTWVKRVARGLATWVKRVARGSARAVAGDIHRQSTPCMGVQRPPLSGNGVHGVLV